MPAQVKNAAASNRRGSSMGGLLLRHQGLAFFLIAVLLMLGVIADSLRGRFQRPSRASVEPVFLRKTSERYGRSFLRVTGGNLGPACALGTADGVLQSSFSFVLRLAG